MSAVSPKDLIKYINDYEDDKKASSSSEPKGEIYPGEFDIDAGDMKKMSESITKATAEQRHLETLKEQARAYSREEQLTVASAIKSDVLLEALGMEIARLNCFEDGIRKIATS